MADKKEDAPGKEDADEDKKEGEAGAEGGDEAAAKRKKKRKLLIIAIAVTALLMGGVGGALYFSGVLFAGHKAETAVTTKKGRKKKKEGDEAERGTTGSSAKAAKPNLNEWTPGVVPGHEGDDVVYYNLPEFLVNLNTGGKQVSYIKMKVTLEAPTDADADAIDSRMPRITDSFNTYLRELRTSDIAGSAGLYRLREELLLRVNKTIYPSKVNDVLFREIIVQ